MNRRRLLLNYGERKANVGDIAYYANGKVKTIAPDKWSSSLGTAVGVVVIPSGFTPDGLARIVSLLWGSASGISQTSYGTTTWGVGGIDTVLTNYNRVPTTSNTSSTSGGSYSQGFLPSDAFTGNQCITDPIAYYKSASFIPSPYLGDDSTFNPEYSKVISGYSNVLSDFNGAANTTSLVKTSSYYAANGANKYDDGASSLQWYLPAMGELGFIMPRLKALNSSLSVSGGAKLEGYLWSSSEYSLSNTWVLYTATGNIYSTLKGYTMAVRPFAMLDF